MENCACRAKVGILSRERSIHLTRDAEARYCGQSVPFARSPDVSLCRRYSASMRDRALGLHDEHCFVPKES